MSGHSFSTFESALQALSFRIVFVMVLEPEVSPGGEGGGQNLGGLWSPVAGCGSLLHPSRSPIEEDKMLRFQDSSCLGARTVRFQDSSCLGARRAGGFLDFSCLATWAGWADVLF